MLITTIPIAIFGIVLYVRGGSAIRQIEVNLQRPPENASTYELEKYILDRPKNEELLKHYQSQRAYGLKSLEVALALWVLFFVARWVVFGFITRKSGVE